MSMERELTAARNVGERSDRQASSLEKLASDSRSGLETERVRTADLSKQLEEEQRRSHKLTVRLEAQDVPSAMKQLRRESEALQHERDQLLSHSRRVQKRSDQLSLAVDARAAELITMIDLCLNPG